MPTSATSRRRGQHGVSLLEMLLVVVLIAAIGMMAAAAFTGGLAGVQLRQAAREVAGQLRHARVRAIATGTPQRFAIDPVAHAWSGADGRAGELPEELGIRFIGARQVQPTEGEGAVVFFPDGASTGGRIRLVRDSAAWDVEVAWLTGEVKLSRVQAQ
ncbi:GspH/FimT family protein [Lysobacter sp. GX 14042]|uniref:type II secretion system protein XpsH n=1 Tax=Lysobacter sp. GX 14042 TaxID=2907155 RepID=UPI001F2DE33F|nr:GspH/FimT family protein [Lysobacter sp. GX 14042]MCE7032756.1 GspH/FimT family protein [Lysobacter sp. GX 14042]